MTVGYLARGKHVLEPVEVETWGDIVRIMGTEYVDMRTFRLGGPFTPVYVAIRLDRATAQREPFGAMFGCCTIYGHALVGRYSNTWPDIAALTADDWRKLR